MKETNKQTRTKKLKDGRIVAGGNLIPTPGLLSFHENKTYILKQILEYIAHIIRERDYSQENSKRGY